MADMHMHPALGMVIARLEGREEDIEELMGIKSSDDKMTFRINLEEWERSMRDLVDLGAFLALEAYAEREPDRTINHEDFPDHVANAIRILREIALRLPLVEGQDDG